jgi:transposase InsO family protein
MTKLCERFGISRQCGYEWWRRALAGGTDFEEGGHRTKRAVVLGQRWRKRVLAMRRDYQFAGAAQLQWYLQRAFPLGPWPGMRTIGRWLQQAGLTRTRRRPYLVGRLIREQVTRAYAPNDVWTVDFKGWFCTRDGHRVCALTVRDLATRYVLLVRHVERSSQATVGALMRSLMFKYGVPRVIRVDNGPPFGGQGPRGWSSLAVSWVCLGIKVEYGRPGCPQDNSEHEQMHQVLHQQTASPAAATRRAQQCRFDRWREAYNRDRPNRAIGMQLPAALYRPSKYAANVLVCRYPRSWVRKLTDPRGRVRWAGAPRQIGRAFAGKTVALKPVKPGVVEVFFGPYLLGELHAADPGAIRALRVQSQARRPQRGG